MNTTPSSTRPVTSTTAHDAAPQADPANRRALVLGGGGSAGNAWVLGVIAGLCDAGVDVTEADLIIGTSAGSTAAVQITGTARPADLYEAILAPAPQPGTRPAGSRPTGSGPAGSSPTASGPTGPGRGPAPHAPMSDLLAKTSAVYAAAAGPADMRRKMGALALEMDATADSDAQAQRRAIVAARLPSQQWPERPLLIVAVDAHTGEPIVFDRDSGVDLVDAVTASTSGPGAPPHTINGNRYIDGGYRASENADLAAGCGRVLVLAPFGGRSRAPQEWGIHLAAQIDELRARGSQVETVFPDGKASDIFAFGANQMDPSTRTPAAQAGFDQGRALAARLADFWR